MSGFETGQKARVRRLPASATALRGPVESFNHDGTLIARQRSTRTRFPWHGVAMILLTLLVFKATAHAVMGAPVYDARAAALSQGHVLEQSLGWVLKPEPVTLWISDKLQMVLR